MPFSSLLHVRGAPTFGALRPADRRSFGRHRGGNTESEAIPLARTILAKMHARRDKRERW